MGAQSLSSVNVGTTKFQLVSLKSYGIDGEPELIKVSLQRLLS